ncbi:MAG TPA: citrate/2-methylcitrate synthase [Caulobacteraceae bacterium]|nr:citrate/2-methylcitrate synthase [Caulobacteraceae bacterium]
MESDFLSAEEAAAALGVSVHTLYVYVGRKGIRSQPIPGSRSRRYWKSDVDRVRRGEEPAPPAIGKLRFESQITLITDQDFYYRGRSALQLAAAASFESVAALLWGAAEDLCFGPTEPVTPDLMAPMRGLLGYQGEMTRAAVLIPLLEEANAKAYDLTPVGMARTGGDILRWLAAIITDSGSPATLPLPQFIARRLQRSEVDADLIRRALVLSADHGFEPGTVAVRTVASTGVTPWRAVITGLSATGGRRPRIGVYDAISRFVSEIIASPDPDDPVLRRIRDGETLPGFDSPVYQHGDPRARTLLAFCAEAFADDRAFRKLASALALIREVRGLEPNFALAHVFVGSRIGLTHRPSLFHLGRAAGWIAHAIEQYAVGENVHVEGLYSGPLPQEIAPGTS